LALALLPLLALEGRAPALLYGLYPLALSLGGLLGALLAWRLGAGGALWGGHLLRLLGLGLLPFFPLGPLGAFLFALGGACRGCTSGPSGSAWPRRPSSDGCRRAGSPWARRRASWAPSSPPSWGPRGR
jgi:hypothetical protein